MKRRIALIASMAVVGSMWMVGSQAGAQGGGGCQLDGTARFKPGLTGTPSNFTYSFTGTLSSCMADPGQSSPPTGGKVSAGSILRFGTERFREPAARGTNSSCEFGTTAGKAIVQWSNRKTTVVSYQTYAVTGGVVLQGSTIPSIKLPAIAPKPGQPRFKIIKTTLYGGDNAGAVGLLTFSPDDPTDCAGTGVTSATISGFTGIGSAS